MTSSAATSHICASVPECLSESSVELEICDRKISGVVDSASSDSYIDEKLARDLGVTIFPGQHYITLAQATS